MVAQPSEYAKNHQIVYFKRVNVKVYEIYLNKANTKNISTCTSVIVTDLLGI